MIKKTIKFIGLAITSLAIAAMITIGQYLGEFEFQLNFFQASLISSGYLVVREMEENLKKINADLDKG